MKIVSSVTFDDECKILKTESRMVNLLRPLKMPLFLEFLRDAFKMHFNNVLEEELVEYIKLNRNKVHMYGLMNLKNG